jgi:hypothetical protein
MNEQERVANELLKKLPIAIGVLAVVFVIILMAVTEYEHTKLYEKARKYNAFAGTVVEKRIDKHKDVLNEIKIEFVSQAHIVGDKKFLISIANDSVFRMIELGDLLIRRPNEVVCSLVKNFDTIVFDPVKGIYAYRNFSHKL